MCLMFLMRRLMTPVRGPKYCQICSSESSILFVCCFALYQQVNLYKRFVDQPYCIGNICKHVNIMQVQFWGRPCNNFLHFRDCTKPLRITFSTFCLFYCCANVSCTIKQMQACLSQSRLCSANCRFCTQYHNIVSDKKYILRLTSYGCQMF